MYVTNASKLIENGRTRAEKRARRLSLGAIDAALQAVEPERLIRSRVKLRDEKLTVGDAAVDLSKFRRLFVIGGGKAGASMATALEKMLGSRIDGGLVNVPESLASAPQGKMTIELHAATHPLPSVKGEEGVRKMLELVGRPTKDTLVLFLISGGGSALMPMPREGLKLSDKVEVTRALLRAGATIQELNVVRKHLSAFKGGWLAKRLYPGTVLSLVISDVVGNRLDSIASGPLYPDPSTFADAERVLKKHGLWNTIPADVADILREGVAGRLPETPKPGSKYFDRVFNVIIGSSDDACEAAMRNLGASGCRSAILTTSYEGEAKSAGMFMGSLLNYSASRPRPLGMIAGGETTVAVKGDGRGGRNQEFALGAAMKIDGTSGISLVSVGTDGVDGSTDAAGAIVDGSTIRRAVSKGISAEDALSRNDSYSFFGKLGDLVMTGPTGTNVNDISVAVLA